jgi:hypothetical protein
MLDITKKATEILKYVDSIFLLLFLFKKSESFPTHVS